MTSPIPPENPGSAPHPSPGADLWSRATPAAAAADARTAASGGWERDVLEKLVFATINEQRAARRWRLFGRLLWTALILVVLWVLFAKDTATTTSSSPHTASRAVVLLINSPGGSPVQAGIINDEIVRLKGKYDKPLYAVVEETCASAAYYIAAAADEIFVDKASIVGSIGVLMDGFGFTGAMEKLGVERRLLTAGENKGFLDPFSPMSEAQRAHAHQMLGQIHSQFVNVVKAGRGDRLHETPETFSGLFWTGQQAVEMGLADKLGSLDYVAREVVKAEEVVDYTRRDNVAERLAKRFGAAFGGGAVQALRSSLPAMR
jgi:protease-4